MRDVCNGGPRVIEVVVLADSNLLDHDAARAWSDRGKKGGAEQREEYNNSRAINW